MTFNSFENILNKRPYKSEGLRDIFHSHSIVAGGLLEMS
jgi:hypothetical protein